MSTVWESGRTSAEEQPERLVSASHTEDDLEIERTLRPRRLAD
jgi:hypothetical protein